MSRYVTYDCQDIRDQEVLLAALAELGWGGDVVEVHADPVPLLNYVGVQTHYTTGDKNKPDVANVIIRRQHTRAGASNDLGFLRKADGSYTAIVSDYDESQCKAEVKGVGRMPFKDAVQRVYGGIVANKVIHTFLTETVPSMKSNGLIPLRASVQPIEEGETMRMVVTY